MGGLSHRRIVAAALRLGWLAFRSLGAGLLIVLMLIMALLQFDPELVAREIGRFLVHLAQATPSARAPVGVALLVMLLGTSWLAGLFDGKDYGAVLSSLRGGADDGAR